MVRLVVLFALLGPALASAQEGRIAFSRSVQYEFELPEGMAQMRDRIPSQNVTDLLLFYSPTESVMLPAPEPESEATGQDRRAAGMAMRLRMRSGSRADLEELRQSWVSFEDGRMSETWRLLGRDFQVAGERPTFAWTLGGEQRKYLDYTVQKATTERDGKQVEAWFTMEIPVPGGPGPYGGLPGMILLVTVDGGTTVYAATDVAADGLLGYEIRRPEADEELTREEYEVVVAEKLAEIQELSTQRRGRRRPF